MIDRLPLFYTILDGEVLPVRCSSTAAHTIDRTIPDGDVVVRGPALDGSDRYEYRKLLRGTKSAMGSDIGNPTQWSAPLHPHEMPALIALYLTLTQ